MQIMEPLQSLQDDLHDCHEYSTPFSPEMTMIIIDHDTNIYIELHYKYYQKEAPKLAVTTTDLASFLDMVIKKPNTHTLG